MSALGASVSLLKSAALGRLLARVGGCGVLGLAMLGWIVEHAGPPDGEAVVHVVEADVRVTVGGKTYPIGERNYAPLVCRLPAGSHELTMSRGGRVIQRETFQVPRGGSIVLTAWDPELKRASTLPPRPAPTARSTRRPRADRPANRIP